MATASAAAASNSLVQILIDDFYYFQPPTKTTRAVLVEEFARVCFGPLLLAASKTLGANRTDQERGRIILTH